jgi:hypothetical protein
MRRPPDPSLLVVAAFSRHAKALDWAQERLSADYGPLALAPFEYDFHHTRYYEKAMGAGLRKRLLVFDALQPPDLLPDAKHHAIRLEQELAATQSYADERPLNLDPGLLHLGKFLLATTKDQAHRLYLRDGIYAEVTLRYHHESFEPWEWTYADYREPSIREYLRRARSHLYGRIRGGG